MAVLPVKSLGLESRRVRDNFKPHSLDLTAGELSPPLRIYQFINLSMRQIVAVSTILT